MHFLLSSVGWKARVPKLCKPAWLSNTRTNSLKAICACRLVFEIILVLALLRKYKKVWCKLKVLLSPSFWQNSRPYFEHLAINCCIFVPCQVHCTRGLNSYSNTELVKNVLLSVLLHHRQQLEHTVILTWPALSLSLSFTVSIIIGEKRLEGLALGRPAALGENLWAPATCNRLQGQQTHLQLHRTNRHTDTSTHTRRFVLLTRAHFPAKNSYNSIYIYIYIYI